MLEKQSGDRLMACFVRQSSDCCDLRGDYLPNSTCSTIFIVHYFIDTVCVLWCVLYYHPSADVYNYVHNAAGCLRGHVAALIHSVALMRVNYTFM